MEDDPVYRDLPTMSKARAGKMPPRDNRINWGLWFGVAFLLFFVTLVGCLIAIVYMVQDINEDMNSLRSEHPSTWTTRHS